jgi:hypothetical protein
MGIRTLLAAFLALALPAAPPGAAIYAGGPVYNGGDGVLDDLRGSGFDTVVAWTLHVNAAGDLVFNDWALVAGGKYVGDPGWGARLDRLKRGGTVRRLLVSVGSAGVGDFHAIQALGTGPDSPLRRNFQALRQALPALDGVDLDDEDLCDPATTKAFSLMLGDLGYRVTFCPYDLRDFWIGCLKDLEAARPGLVTAFHLQCYAGGWGNRPGDWMDAVHAALGAGYPAEDLVRPGLWCRHGGGCQEGDDPDGVAAAFSAWKDQGVRNGFIWLYDDLQGCRSQAPEGASWSTAAYAQAVKD